MADYDDLMASNMDNYTSDMSKNNGFSTPADTANGPPESSSDGPPVGQTADQYTPDMSKNNGFSTTADLGNGPPRSSSDGPPVGQTANLGNGPSTAQPNFNGYDPNKYGTQYNPSTGQPTNGANDAARMALNPQANGMPAYQPGTSSIGIGQPVASSSFGSDINQKLDEIQDRFDRRDKERSDKDDKDEEDKKKEKRAKAVQDAIKEAGKQMQGDNKNELKIPTINMPQFQVPQFQPYVPQRPVYSDENLKTNIKDTSSKDIDDFINSISNPKSFDYKDKTLGSHTEGGLIAQDLQRSKIGSSVVVKTQKGLAVDTAKLTPIITSIMASRLKTIEDKVNTALNQKFKGKKNAR